MSTTESPYAPGTQAAPPDDEYCYNITDLLIMVRALMTFRVESLGPSGAEFCAYRQSAAARRELTVTAEDHGDHGTALRIRLDGAGAEVAPPKPGRRARVEVKGFRDLGIVRVTETTLAGEAMLHAERDDGSSADFPASSLHFITWLPEGAPEMTRAMLPPGRGGFDPAYELGDTADDDDTESPF